MLLSFLAVTVVGALSSGEPRFDERKSTGVPTAEAAATPTVKASLPAKGPIRANVGDVVHLSVRVPASDLVEISDLALEQPVDPGVPAELEFVADQAGSFPVRLRDAGDEIGTLEIAG